MVKSVPITFHKIEVCSQDLGSTDEHMVSRLHAEVTPTGQPRRPITVAIKQTVGSTFDRESIEVLGCPDGLDAIAFRGEVADYYLGLVSTSTGAAIRLERAASLKLRNCSLARDVSVSIPLAERQRGGGW